MTVMDADEYRRNLRSNGLEMLDLPVATWQDLKPAMPALVSRSVGSPAGMREALGITR